MLKLPSKRWKKAQAKAEDQGRCILTFTSPIYDEHELREVVEEDIETCLQQGDRVIGIEWDTKSVMLEISDCETFKRRLIFVNILIEE
ncbi:MAG: hypothetical protein ABSB94_05300 [Syntrophorhabdales bacterium]|jgi:hypothetical protein